MTTDPDRPDTPAARRAVTLRTVGERCGLHASTVSRALRRAADADATAARVHAAAREVGYQPDMVAASMRTRRSRVVGMLVHALTDVVQAILVEEVEDELAAHGYQLLVVNTHDRSAVQRAKVELMRSRRVDGLIIADGHVDGAYVDWVASLGIPYVLALRRAGDHPAMVGDDMRGGELAAAHLADLGHRRIGLLQGPAYASTSAGRAAGFRAELARRGLALPGGLCESCELFARGGHDAMARLLARTRDLTAVFAVNDMAAIGAIGALRSAGLRPGWDVAVVGYNDLSVAAPFGLTTVRGRQQEIGRLAARSLLGALDGEPPRTVVLEPALVVRETTRPPRAAP
jgi:LacI family transcriptional regulator